MEDLNLPQETNDNDRIIKVNIEEQMKTAYIDYSMSVIVGRALPDVRDGFKPVHRRILYAMNELNLDYGKPYKKSARIVGEVMGKYHPHGDSAIYDTMVRLAQEWSMRYTLVDGQGNFGNQDGDGAAAMRYTEARLQKLTEFILKDIEKETVDFHGNFDDSLQEPTVLPTRIPQLLINGSTGIAVGMATNMLPHNLSEVVDGCLAYIENKDITIEELIKYVKGPDFPTAGVIHGFEGVKQGLMTGRGRVVLRGKATFETDDKGREKIIITEVPYQVNRDQLTNRIGQLVNDKVIEGVSNVNNESNLKEGTRVVLDLKRDGVAQVILNQLFKLTELQTSYGINNVALVKGRPRTLNLKDLIAEFIDFRHEVVIRRTEFELRKAKERAHILEGYMKVIGTQDDLDLAIKIIRESKTPDLAREGLIEAFTLSDLQARAILELRLRTLTGLEIDKIREEYDEIMKTINHLQLILDTESMRFEIISDELKEVKEKFGDERKTQIQYLADEISIEDLIEKEDVVITISNLGYIKRTSATEFRQQRRGGRGAKAGSTRNEDFFEHLFVANTHHTMLFFTEKGRLYWLKVYEIPEGEKNSKGRAIQNMMQIPQDDKVRAIIDIENLDDKDFVDNHYIVLCTKKGVIKKTPLSEFSRRRSTGVNAITILEGDQLLEAKLTDGTSDIMMALKSGRAIRFPEEKVRPTGRGAIGVGGIEVDDETDEVVGMVCLSDDDVKNGVNILVVSEQGFGKKTPIDEYRITNRGGKGVKTINVTEKTGTLVGILDVTDANDLMISCKSGITIRTGVDSIREAGRATQGVTLIKVNNNDFIAAITKLAKFEEDVEQEITEGTLPVIDENTPLNDDSEQSSNNSEETSTTEN
ncbi:DNA gyrase subunit A [Polluticaenibacter yanchengensis]|uniref:DNA gyrase subunit A n=1 Tax=Polluticaenibacter yanchengensis TaxID=3014562 RepID=A0ABT4UHQ0_9BACT|nr:DNA gyrase subunit A [Chitinophagaceae bacterium LY-5]